MDNKKANKKRLIVIILVILFLIIIGISAFIFYKVLTKPKIIELTNENFNDYIIFNIDISNFEVEKGRGLYAWYKGTAQLNASAKLKKDVEIDNVVINVRTVTSGLCWAGNQYEFVLELDKNGEAEYSKEISTGDAGMLYPDEPNFHILEVDKLENEFINKNAFLKVSGSIIE